jgi:hypothetical protein
MIRRSQILAPAIAALMLAAACGENAPAAPDPAPTAETPPPAATPDPTMLPTPQQDTAMTVTCGGQPYGLSFGEFAATLTYDDGTTAELAMQPPTADSEPGVTVFSDGKVSIARSGDTPAVIRFARARAAWEDCAISQN